MYRAPELEFIRFNAGCFMLSCYGVNGALQFVIVKQVRGRNGSISFSGRWRRLARDGRRSLGGADSTPRRVNPGRTRGCHVRCCQRICEGEDCSGGSEAARGCGGRGGRRATKELDVQRRRTPRLAGLVPGRVGGGMLGKLYLPRLRSVLCAGTLGGWYLGVECGAEWRF